MTDLRLIRPTIIVQFIDECLEGARKKGLDTDRLLRKTGINPEMLQNPQTYISILKYSQILTAVRKSLQDECSGFLKKQIPTGAFSVFCEAATGYQNISDLVTFANRFYSLFSNQFSWVLETDGKRQVTRLCAELAIDSTLNPKFLLEGMLLVPYRLISWLIGEQLPIKQAYFQFDDPGCPEQHRYLFGENITYNSDRNGLDFDMVIENQPLVRKPSDVRRFLKTFPRWLLLNPYAYPFTRKVRQKLLSQAASEGLLTFEEVAKSINISHQHLWRKLKEEGTSYQRIKDQLRRDMAIHFLGFPELNITDIAARIGYTDERHFYRMFRKWTGMSPGTYRELLHS